MRSLNDRQEAALALIREMTLVSRGPRKGQLKRRIMLDHMDGRTVRALLTRGLLTYGSDTTGTGFAAVPEGNAGTVTK